VSAVRRADSELALAHAGGSLRAVQAAGHRFRWLLLTEDYLSLLRWRDAITEISGEVVPPGPLVSAAAERLRGPFLDLITELGRRHSSVAWWASRLSERNTAVSPLFLHCCYLSAAEGQLTSGDLGVVSDSWAVLESLADIARARSIPVRWVTRRPGPAAGLDSAARILARVGRFLARGVAHRVRAPEPIDPATVAHPLVLSRTWPDEASFGAEGAFGDRYFPGLHAWLEERGASTVTIPMLSNLRGSYRSVWRRLQNTDRRFLAPEAYYRASDYLFALRTARRGAAMPGGRGLRLGELDVSRLFAFERRRTSFDIGSLEVILSYRLPMRLAAAGLAPELLIEAFENMIPEKPFLLGFRRYLPATKLVGFQHGALYPLFLCNFITAGESGFAPMPDRVVCNGEMFRRILVREGLPRARAVVGPSLRYTHLWEPGRNLDEHPVTPDSLLVPLPLMLDAAAELLVKLQLAFANDDRVRVVLKPHPMSLGEELFRTARMEKLPPNFARVGGSMGSALSGAKVVVGIASSSLYEALAAGKPVVVVGRDAALNLNPLAWHEDLSAVFSEPNEIRAETLRLLSLPPAELAAYRARAGEILRESFNQVTDEAMRAFTDGLIDLSVGGVALDDG
jgi:hypothetical protein